VTCHGTVLLHRVLLHSIDSVMKYILAVEEVLQICTYARFYGMDTASVVYWPEF
jgi:hypothetical protein